MTRHGNIPLGAGKEFDRIRAIWARLGDRAQAGGDDAAIIDVPAGRLALTTDLAIEGRHFRTEWLSAEEIGWRATAAALSDLAAVAAEPVGVLASVGVPAERSEAFLEELMSGVGAAAGAAGADVWGGDLVRSTIVVVGVTCVGRPTRAITRAGARPGDRLWVTGRLGGPAAALAAWSGGREPDAEARARFAHPSPRIREAHWLRDRGASAMIDVSDGLAADAGHLAAASGARCTIDVERVPLFDGVSWERALASGEEYELLVAGPADAFDAASFAAVFGIPLTRVGSVEAGTGVVLLGAGRPVNGVAGFSHF